MNVWLWISLGIIALMVARIAFRLITRDRAETPEIEAEAKRQFDLMRSMEPVNRGYWSGQHKKDREVCRDIARKKLAKSA